MALPSWRRALQCHAAASGYSAEQLAVPDGEFKIPLVTDVANTLEWLTDYEAFYRKRCRCSACRELQQLCHGCFSS